MNLFVLHSPIAELILLKLIDDGEIRLDNLKIFSIRDYVPVSKPLKNIEILSVSKVWPFRIHAVVKRTRFWAMWETRKNFRINILKHTNQEDFILHAPYLYLLPIYEIVQMTACKGIYYYEEGIGSFGPIERFEKFRLRGEKGVFNKIMFRINYGNEFPNEQKFFDFSHPKYKGAYAFSEECFPIKSRKLLQWPKPADVCPVIVREDYLKYDKACVLLMDLFYVRHRLNWEAAFFPLLNFVRKAKKMGIKKLYYRYHPDQANDKEFIKRFNRLFLAQEEIFFEEIPPQISIEMLSILTVNTYFVFYSSLALYVKKNPLNTVFNLHKFVSSLYILKEDVLTENVPPSFWENTTMLEP